MSEYLEQLRDLMQTIEEQEDSSMEEAATLIFEALQNRGILQIFGCGHSHLLAQDAFYRAGGLVPVKPISIEPLMLHSGALTSSSNEKDASKADEFWSQFELAEQDILLIISTSGRNPIPVEMALRAQKQGITVITLQSLAYCEQLSRHASGQRLEQFSNLVLNSHVPVGDGIVQKDQLQFGPVSTIAGATILNEVIVRVIQLLQQHTEQVPVFTSNNADSERNSNNLYIEQYQNRIKFN